MTLLQSVFTTVVADEGRIVAENDLAFAFITNIPITEGHTLVAPKRVVKTLKQMNDAEKLAVLELVEDMELVLAEIFGAEGFNYAWNQGDEFGQSVPHFHVHIVPRKKGDGGVDNFDPRKVFYRPGDRQLSTESELSRTADMIRRHVKLNNRS